MVSLGTLLLTWVGVYIRALTPIHLCVKCARACVFVCNSVPGGHLNTVSISSGTCGSWWRTGTRATLLMSYCCTLLWNIIALWCVNKAGSCCHSICSLACQTGTTSLGRMRWGGISSNKRKAQGSSWNAVLGVQQNWLASLWKVAVDGCLCIGRTSKSSIYKRSSRLLCHFKLFMTDTSEFKRQSLIFSLCNSEEAWTHESDFNIL